MQKYLMRMCYFTFQIENRKKNNKKYLSIF